MHLMQKDTIQLQVGNVLMLKVEITFNLVLQRVVKNFSMQKQKAMHRMQKVRLMLLADILMQRVVVTAL